jgi:PST family polysaccharide transporter
MQGVSNEDAKRAPAMARHAAAGALYIGGSQVVRFLLSIATTIVVARILSPGDYGVIAMWAPIFAFVTLFQDFGFSTATVQAEQLSTEQSSTLFWVNVLASVVIALLLIIGAQAVGAFYGDPRVASVTAASASIVLVGGLTIQHTALLNRDMKFRALALIGLATPLANTVTTIALAMYLRSYWALFLGNLASVIVQTLLTWGMSGWRPGRSASLRGTRDVLAFGAHVATFNVVNFLARNADNVLIGKMWGAAALGLYDRSYKLMITPLQFINAPLSRVTLPVLSRLRDEPERFRKAYLFIFGSILLATAPGAVVAAAESDKIVLLLLGQKWSGAAPIFFWLALVMIYQPAASSLGWLLLARGRSRAYAVFGVFSSIATVASFVIGLPGGGAGVARAYFFVNFFLIASSLLVWATKDSALGVLDVILSALPTLVAAAISWLLVRSVDAQLSPLVLIILSVPASYLIAVATIWLSPQGRAFLADVLQLIKTGRALDGATSAG